MIPEGVVGDGEHPKASKLTAESVDVSKSM